MGASKAQIDEIEVLHAAGADYDASLLTEWDQTSADKAYMIGPNDPYELAGAQLASAILSFALTPDQATLDVTPLNAGTSLSVDLDATLTYKGDTNIDDSFEFFVKPGPLTVDANGLVIWDNVTHAYSGYEYVTVTWKKDKNVSKILKVYYTFT